MASEDYNARLRLGSLYQHYYCLDCEDYIATLDVLSHINYYTHKVVPVYHTSSIPASGPFPATNADVLGIQIFS